MQIAEPLVGSALAGALGDPSDLSDSLQQSLDCLSQMLAKEAERAKALQREVCLRLIDEDESAQLNKQYRGYDRPTNVLSFPSDVPALPLDIPPLGDLAICWPLVISEAAAQHKATLDHLHHLVIHGTLHLLGMDHEETAQAQEMEALEVAVLELLGMTNPYEL